MAKLADFLWNEGAQVDWIVNLGWALASSAERVNDPLESFLEDLEPDKFKKLFGIPINTDENYFAERLLEYQKEGFLAEITIADREDWTEKGWRETGSRFILHVYAEDISALEVQIVEVVRQVVEEIRAKRFKSSSTLPRGDRS